MRYYPTIFSVPEKDPNFFVLRRARDGALVKFCPRNLDTCEVV